MPGWRARRVGREGRDVDQRAEDGPGLEKEKGNTSVGQVRQPRGRCRAVRRDGQHITERADPWAGRHTTARVDGWTAQTLGRMSASPALVQPIAGRSQLGSPDVEDLQSTPGARAVARWEAIALAKPRHCLSGWRHPAGDEQREGRRRLDVGCVCCIGGCRAGRGPGIGP